jgi:hypothetical protein
VTISFVELSIGGDSGLTALRAIRLMRILRSAKLLKQFQSLRRLMHVVVQAFIDMKDFFCLLALFLFIFSILGMGLFGGLPGFNVGSRADFDSLLMSFYSVFEALAGAWCSSGFRSWILE